jgi:hypothetical protein
VTTATRSRPVLSDEQLGELLGLIAGADSVELKLTVPEAEQRSAIAALGMDPLDAQIRQVYFFDTPDLALYKKGVVVRGRRVQRKGDDTVVKLRPVLPDALPKKLRKSPQFGVEVDAMPGGYVCSGSLKGVPTKADVRETCTGGAALRKLFSKEQRALFAEHAPADVGLDDLSVLGPIFVLKLKFTPAELAQRLVAELWLYPDDSRILELSTKCPPQDTFLVAAEVRSYLNSRGVDLSGEQQTKTRKALQFFSRRLTSEQSSGSRGRSPRPARP